MLIPPSIPKNVEWPALNEDKYQVYGAHDEDKDRRPSDDGTELLVGEYAKEEGQNR